METREFIRAHGDQYVDWLTQACSFSSLAGDDQGLADMANWLELKFKEIGGNPERLTLTGAPDAFLATFGSGRRSVLVYDHYDVQPVDPLDLWESKPFQPEIRNGAIYARGVADNKGDLIARLAALDVYRQTKGELPITIKFLVEGEEETGSESFLELVKTYGDRLKADGCIWEGDGLDHAGRPMLVFGAKGLAYVELKYRGLSEDQHSMNAVHAPSPVWHLVEALATLRSPEGRVLIDGFYDDVETPTEADLQLLDALPFDEGAEKERLGVDSFVGGVTGLDLKKRYYFEPTCNIAGINAGFTVPHASKTVLPKEAMAKLDMRLVPNQDPDDIVDKVRAHLDARGFEKIELERYSMEHPVRSPAESSIGRAAVEASSVFDKDPVVQPLMIGTGPMYPVASTLGIPTVSPAGVCRPDSNIHAPNEHCLVEDFLKTIEYTVAWIDRFAALG